MPTCVCVWVNKEISFYTCDPNNFPEFLGSEREQAALLIIMPLYECVCVCVLVLVVGILCCVVIYCIRVPDFTNVMRHTMPPILLPPPQHPSALMHMQSFEYFALWMCHSVSVCVSVRGLQGYVCVSVYLCAEEFSHKYSVRSHISFFRFVCAPLLQSGVDIRVGIIWLPFLRSPFRLQFLFLFSAWP